MTHMILMIIFGISILFQHSSNNLSGFDCSAKISNKDEQKFGREYFPVDLKSNLIYNSSFGELKLKVTRENDIHQFSYNSDKFKYKQKLFVNDDGLFVNETYEKLNLLLFINKEGNYVYDKPLLRIPFPVEIGQEWEWTGKEFVDDETHDVKLKGKTSKYESVTTPAGKFNALKVVSTIETSNGTKNIISEWYAKDIGMIKMEVIIEGGGILGVARDVLGYGKIEFELEKIEKL